MALTKVSSDVIGTLDTLTVTGNIIAGSVGIGNTNPLHTLSVNGTGNFTNAVSAPTFTGNLTGTATNSGTANNASFLGGTPAASYALTTNLPAGGFGNMQVYTASGTFTVPAGITKVKVTVIGAGGGGGGQVVGSTGGTSSFGSFCSATGGGGGFFGSVGGVGSGGNLNFTGITGVYGGASALAYGVGGRLNGSTGNGFPGVAYGGGGGEANDAFDSVGVPGSGGGGAIEVISGLTPGGTVSVTVGVGGAGGSGGGGGTGGTGAAGVVVVEW